MPTRTPHTTCSSSARNMEQCLTQEHTERCSKLFFHFSLNNFPLASSTLITLGYAFVPEKPQGGEEGKTHKRKEVMEGFFNASKGKICFKIKTPSRGSTLFFTHKGNNAQVLARLAAPCGQEGAFSTHRVSHAGQSLDLGNIFRVLARENFPPPVCSGKQGTPQSLGTTGQA